MQGLDSLFQTLAFLFLPSTNLIDTCCIEDKPSVISGAEGENKETQDNNSSNLVTPSEVVDVSSTSLSSQLELFWGKDPTIIISMIQLMQFGYAMLLSYVFVYWSLIKRANWGPYGMISVCIVCFGVFFFIMTRIVPRFILCTNIGQLVDKVKLRELLAKHRLEEAIQKKRKINAEKQAAYLQLTTPKPTEGLIDEETKNYSSLSDLAAETQEKLPALLTQNERMTNASEGDTISETQEYKSTNIVPSIDSLVPEKPCVPSANNGQKYVKPLKDSSTRKKLRKKSASEGVLKMLQREAANISLVKSSSAGVLYSDGEQEQLKREETLSMATVGTERIRSRNRKSISEGVAAMRMDAIRLSSLIEAETVCEEAHFGTLAELVSMPTKDLPKIRPVSELCNVVEDTTDNSGYIVAMDLPNVSSRALSRKKRMKSLSEGVAFMRSATALEEPMPIRSSKEPFKRSDGKHPFPSLKSALHVATEGAQVETSSHEMVWQHGEKKQSSFVAERQRRRSASAGVDEMRSFEPGMDQYNTPKGVVAATAMRASSKDEDAECEEGRFGTIADLVATTAKNLPEIRSFSESNVVDDTAAIDSGSGEEGVEKSAVSTKNLDKIKQMRQSFSEGDVSMRVNTIFQCATPHERDNIPFGRVTSRPTSRDSRASKSIGSSVEWPSSEALDLTRKSSKLCDNVASLKNGFSNSTPHADDDTEDLIVKIPNSSNAVEQNASKSAPFNRSGELISKEENQKQSSEGNSFGVLESYTELDYSPINSMLLLKHFRSFFSSKLFNTIDVFGTMSCFFVVAMRMNSFLVTSHKVDGKFVFTPSAENLFWVEVSFHDCILMFQLAKYVT